MSLQFRLLAPILAGGLVFGATLHFYWAPRYLLEENDLLRAQQERMVSQLNFNMVDALLSGNLDSVYRTITQFRQSNPIWRAVELNNPQGKRIFPLASTVHEPGDNDISIKQTITFNDVTLGTVIVTVDASQSANDVQRRIRETQILFWLLLLLTIAAVYVIVKRAVIRPIFHLVDALKFVGEGNFTEPARFTGGTAKDLFPLYSAFLEMKKSRHQAETRLRESNDLANQALRRLKNFQFAIDQHEIILTLNSTGEIVSTNSKFLGLLGLVADEVVGKPYKNFVAAQHGEHFVEELIGKLGGEKSWHGDLLHIGSTGIRAWLNVTAIEFEHASGEEQQFVILATDISARKLAEIALKEQKTLLESVITNTPVILWAVDRQGIFSLSMGRGLRDLGWAPGQIVGKSVFEVYRHHTEFLAGVKRALKGESLVTEHQISNRWFETHFASVADGELHSGAIGISVDISERRATEHQLRLAKRVFEDAGEGMVITDANTRIIAVNRAFTKVTGYREKEAIGQTPRLLASGKQDKQFYADMWNALQTDGQWSGEIWNKRKNGEIYPEWLSISSVRDSTNRISNFVGIFSDITDRKREQMEIEHLAHHDALTGLPNRILLRDRFEQAAAYAAREGGKVALMFLDLDRFKEINDTLGHHVGDELLKTVAQRLTRCVRQTDTISRQGGDEFLVVMPRVGEAKHATLIAKKIIESLSQPMDFEGHIVHTSASVGIGIYPDDGNDFESVVNSADTAMYHAKQEGRNGYRFFDERMHAKASARRKLEHHLQGAIEHGEMELYFQPQVHLATSKRRGAEALLRWSNAELGLVEPGRFIDVAEETGLILPIGEWVINQACAQWLVWQRAGLDIAYVSINLSTLQILRGEFADMLETVLANHPIPPGALELELTETALSKNLNAMTKVLQRLRGLGVKLVIDNFGLGYTRLAQLLSLGIHKLKIDRSLIRECQPGSNGEKLVSAIVTMAHELGVEAVAEGVERTDERDTLLKLGCDYGQGFYFDPACDATEFARRWRAVVSDPSKHSRRA